MHKYQSLQVILQESIKMDKDSIHIISYTNEK